MRPDNFVDIEGFEGLYAISEDGDIYCYPKYRKTGWVKERIMAKYKKPEGYINACLCKDGKKYWRMVHRLVAETFIPNPQGRRCINHKDGNKANNSIDNIEWCTYSENHKHAYRTGLKKPSLKQRQAVKRRWEEYRCQKSL